jgi:pSer/pThr/pTyr-binding forkhead associated (FHA) protein
MPERDGNRAAVSRSADPAGDGTLGSRARYGRHIDRHSGWEAGRADPQPDDAAAASEEQRVTEKDNDQTSDEVTVETTSVFRADFLNELDAPAQAGTETSVSGVEGLPVGSALLVVKRGPNAGSRFLLDQPTTSAGRHPDSDIFLDDVTVSRRHAEFRLETDEFHVVDVGSLNGTYVNREPVDSAVLANGDEVQIGKFRLVFLTGPKGGEDNGGPGS